jgi:hypothetical protein
MSDTLLLNCWVLGNDPKRVFTVKIGKKETVDDVKNVIKEEKKPELDHLAADSLQLWKVSELVYRFFFVNLSRLERCPSLAIRSYVQN